MDLFITPPTVNYVSIPKVDATTHTQPIILPPGPVDATTQTQHIFLPPKSVDDTTQT